jgi:dephospho-CoA kinase
MINQENDLKQEFLEHLDLDTLAKHKLPRTIVIGFIASIGSGKTTISQLLSTKLHIPILDNDGVRRFLNAKGISGESPLPDLVIDIARTRMRLVLERGISYILDADLTLTYLEDIQRIASMGAKLILIKIVCPETLTLHRIDARQKNANMLVADKQRYFARQKLRAGIEIDPKHIFFTIDNSNDLNAQIDALVSKIRNHD